MCSTKRYLSFRVKTKTVTIHPVDAAAAVTGETTVPHTPLILITILTTEETVLRHIIEGVARAAEEVKLIILLSRFYIDEFFFIGSQPCDRTPPRGLKISTQTLLEDIAKVWG